MPGANIFPFDSSDQIPCADPLLTIFNNASLLTILNKESRREETALKVISTYHWAVLKKISRSFSSPTTFYLHIRQHWIKLHVIFFQTWSFFKNDSLYKVRPLLTIVNNNPSLSGANNDPLFTIVKIFINEKKIQKQ